MNNDKWLISVKNEIGRMPPRLFQLLSNMSIQEDEVGVFAESMKGKILECIKISKFFLGEIRASAPNYTLHDITHSMNVVDLMGQLIEVDHLSAVEITLLIYSALLHDIGMVKLANENISLDDLREDHGNRSAKFIKEGVLRNNEEEPLSFGEYRSFYIQYLPLICASHMQDFIFVEKLPYDLKLSGMRVNILLCAILLRLADAMDISRNRAPYALLDYLKLKGVSAEHWQKHLSIINCQIDDNGIYRVDGICEDEKIHRCLFGHFDLIESELSKVFRWYVNKNIPSHLVVKNNIILRNINPRGYQLWNHAIQMDFPAISRLFMGEHLYGNKRVALRELIQNAIDACLVKKEVSKDYSYEPKIDMYFDFDNDYFFIRDNGTGMSEDILRKYFLNIGVSFYRSNDFIKLKLDYDPSGFFGIGFLSCFMLSDEVQVRTRAWNEASEHILHLHKEDRFVSMYTNNSSSFSGTEIRLKLSSVQQAFDIGKKEQPLISAIKEYVSPMFWRLKFKETGDKLSSKIYPKPFQEYSKNQMSGIRKYHKIDVSQYLDGVEGLILLEELENAKKLWGLSGVYYHKLLDPIKEGKIVFGGNIERHLPLCKNAYIFDGKKIIKTSSLSEIEDGEFSDWIVIMKLKGIDSANSITYSDMFSQKIGADRYISIISTVPLSKYLNDRNSTLYAGFYDYGIKKSILLDLLETNFQFQNHNVAKSKMDNRPHDQLIYTEAPTVMLPNEEVFLKHTIIQAGRNEDIFNCFGFHCYKYMLCISNNKIMPNTSRSDLLQTHKIDLQRALRVCFYLWLLDELVNYPEAINTCIYLIRKIEGLWSNDNPFLVSAKNKYLSSGWFEHLTYKK